MNDEIHYKDFDPERHMPGVLALCEAEGWESFTQSPCLTRESLTAPGVTTVVGVSNARIVGFAQIQGDGVLQAHLSLLAVEKRRRRERIGKSLVEEAFERSGAKRLDLISQHGSEEFYRSLKHREQVGFRLYQGAASKRSMT